MQTYKNLNGNSNVTAYEFGPASIKVQFGDGSVYLYTDLSCGFANISNMKALATQGYGLNSYINRNVRKLYQQKLV